MCDTTEREMKRMLEAIFRWRGESGAWVAVEGEEGGEKGVKNIGAEETGGKNRAVSTEAAGYVERDGREEDGTARREEGVKKERSRWW